MKRILIAIHRADEAARVQQALELQGHRVAWLADGGQFLTFCQKHQPDLVIVDVDLPVVNGWAVVHGLRGEELTKSIPAIGLSAHATPMEEQQAQSIGFQHLVAKPLEMERLLARVERVLAAGPAPGVGLASGAATPVSPVAGAASASAAGAAGDESNQDDTSFARVHQVAKSIGELVNVLRPHAPVLGNDGPEMFGYIEKGERQISTELSKIEAQGPAVTEHALYDKELRHDFRNMIGSVTGFAELILMEAGLDPNLAGTLTRLREHSSEFVRLLDAQKAAAAVA